MKKNLLSLLVILGISLSAIAQGNLQFSQAKIITDSQVTVPTGKVWKVTSVYGAENTCLDKQNAENASWTYRKVFNTSFWVNGVEITSSTVDYQSRLWCNLGCGTCITNWPDDLRSRSSDPNILPMWLPESTTLRSGGPNTFVSVLEFNIIP